MTPNSISRPKVIRGFIILQLLSVTTACALIMLPSSQTQAAETPQSPVREDFPEWEARMELARLLLDAKRYDEAVEQYRRVLRNKPDLTQARIKLASALFWNGKTDEALGELSTIPENALDAEGRRLRAELFFSRGDHAKAIQDLQYYLAQQPGDHKARLKLADALSWQKRYGESLTEFETILRSVPEDRQVRRRYAKVLNWAGRNEDSIKELRKSLEP